MIDQGPEVKYKRELKEKGGGGMGNIPSFPCNNSKGHRGGKEEEEEVSMRK